MRSALEEQLRDFPDDHRPTKLAGFWASLPLRRGDRQRAETVWSAIALASPRWLDSRLAIAGLDRDELDRQQINPDRHKLMELFDRADHFLERAISQARPEEARAELLLARARLNLSPRVGTPETARDLCERVSRLAPLPAFQYRARLYRLVALVEIGRYVEAERAAQSHASWRNPADVAALFDAARLLDQCAATAESDLRQRRFGLVLRLMVEPIVTGTDEKLDPDRQSELAMRLTRAFLFTGADREARRSVAAWRGGPQSTDEPLLRDLGDTYNRLEAYSLDIDVRAPAVEEQSVRLAPLARRPLCAGSRLFPCRPAERSRPAHRLDRDPASRARRSRPPRQVYPSPPAARAKAVTHRGFWTPVSGDSR